MSSSGSRVDSQEICFNCHNYDTYVTGVDSSAGAVALAEENARLNGLEDRCSFIRADVFDLLRDLGRRGERFGTVILDPPAFVKSKKKLKERKKCWI